VERGLLCDLLKMTASGAGFNVHGKDAFEREEVTVLGK
jgi:hypothetical protein